MNEKPNRMSLRFPKVSSRFAVSIAAWSVAVAAITAAGERQAEPLHLAAYESGVDRWDEIEVAIPAAACSAFWTSGTLSYSLELAAGSDCPFVDATAGESRIALSSSWNASGCQVVLKLKNPDFAIDGAIQNVGQALVRPKDTVADEWVSRKFLAAQGRFRFTWTWGDGLFAWYLNDKCIYKLPIRAQGLAGLGPVLRLYGMDVQDVRLFSRPLSPEGVTQIVRGEAAAGALECSTTKVLPREVFKVLQYEKKKAEAASVKGGMEIPKPTPETSLFDNDGNVTGRWGVGQSLLCSKDVQFRFGDHETGVLLPTRMHYGIFGGSPLMRHISYGPVLIVPEDGYKLRWYRLLGGCTGDPGRDAAQDENAYDGSAIDVLVSYDRGATVYGLNEARLKAGERRFRLTPQMGELSHAGKAFKVLPRITVAPLARADDSLDSTILVQVVLENNDTEKHHASAALALRTHFARIDRNVNRKLATRVEMNGGRLWVTGDEGLTMALVASRPVTGAAANPVGEGSMPSFYSATECFGLAKGELLRTIAPVAKGLKDKVLALQVDLGDLPPGGSQTAYFLLVFGTDGKRVAGKADAFSQPDDFARALNDTRAFWDRDVPVLETPSAEINAAQRWYINALRSCVYPTGILVTGRASYLSESHYSQDLWYAIPGFAMDIHPLARKGLATTLDLFFKERMLPDAESFGMASRTADPLRYRGTDEKTHPNPIRVIPSLYYYWVYTGDEKRVAECLPYARRMVDNWLKASKDNLTDAIKRSGSIETLSLEAQAIEGPWMLDRLAELVTHFHANDQEAVARANFYRSEANRCRWQYNERHEIGLGTEWPLARDGNFAEGIYLGTFARPMLQCAALARPHDGSYSTDWYWWDSTLARAYGALADVDPRFIDGVPVLARRMADALVGHNTICSPGEYLDEDNAQHQAVGGAPAYFVPAGLFRFSEQIAGLGIDPRLPRLWPRMAMRGVVCQGMKYDVNVVRDPRDPSAYVQPAEVTVNGKPWASLVLPRTKEPASVEVRMAGVGQPMLKRTGALTTEVAAAGWDNATLRLELALKPSPYATERIVIATAGRPVLNVAGGEIVRWSQLHRELTIEVPALKPRHELALQFQP